MKIYIIRHGQTELNVQGLINGQIHDALTAEGVNQAKAASTNLPKTIKRIYASSLKRAEQTARILNSELKAILTLHDELKEVNFGVIEGTPFLDEHKLRHKLVDYDWRPSGESVEGVKKRTLKILKKIKAENDDGEALIVAHGGTIRMLHFLEHGVPIEAEIGNAEFYSFDLDKIIEKE